MSDDYDDIDELIDTDPIELGRRCRKAEAEVARIEKWGTDAPSLTEAVIDWLGAEYHDEETCDGIVDLIAEFRTKCDRYRATLAAPTEPEPAMSEPLGTCRRLPATLHPNRMAQSHVCVDWLEEGRAATAEPEDEPPYTGDEPWWDHGNQ